MLDRLGTSDGQLAKLRYLESDFQIIVHVTHVTCAVTGNKILLDDLKYWDPVHQEAYEDAHASLAALKSRKEG